MGLTQEELSSLTLFFCFVQQIEMDRALNFLNLEMGLHLKSNSRNVPINFTKDEINLYIQRFRSLDTDHKGYITINDLRRYFKVRISVFCRFVKGF